MTTEKDLLRAKRLLAKSELRRVELEHLIDTGQAFQRRILADVEQSKATLQKLYDQLHEEQKRTDQLLTSIMPETVAVELKQSGGVVPKRHDMAAVMFTDFVGFTTHAEGLDPLMLVQVLDQYYSEFDRISARHGVEKVKTIGDAYMCAAGLGGSTEDDLLAAATEMLKFVKTVRPFGLPDDAPLWTIRIGINSGPVSAGVIGQDRLSFDIWGNAVNIASRVVDACAENEIFISRSTYDRVSAKSGFTLFGEIEAKGRGPVEVYRSTADSDYSI